MMGHLTGNKFNRWNKSKIVAGFWEELHLTLNNQREELQKQENPQLKTENF